MNKIPEIGERYAVAESDRVDSRYWGLIGTVADVDLARLTVLLDIPRNYADALKVWLHADYLLPLDDAGHIIRSTEAEEEKARPISAVVREDPPVAVPGFITVTAAPQSFLLSFSEVKHVREMIDIRDILCVIEQDNGSAMIVRRSDENKPAVPLLVTVESFDEVARRMRRATEHAENHRD